MENNFVRTGILLLSFLQFFVVTATENITLDSLVISPKNSKNIYNEDKIDVASDFTFNHIEKEFSSSNRILVDAKSEAEDIFKEIEATNNWKSSFSGGDITSLPLGIKHIVNEVEYQVGFAEGQFKKEHTEFKVFARVVLPQSDENGQPLELFFGSDNVKISRQGGIVGDTKLVLIGDTHIPFHGKKWEVTLKGANGYKNVNLQGKTSVSINCSGVESMTLEGSLHISRDLLIPVKENGKLATSERVSAPFTVSGSEWNDLIVNVNLPPFVLANQQDKFMFIASEAVFDFSDKKNPENITFPQYYYDKALLMAHENLWRGIYIKSLKIGLPKVFKTHKSIKDEDRVYFNAENLLIDEGGVSGSFEATNIIKLHEGITSTPVGWQMSVSKISLELERNNIVTSNFNGKISPPYGNFSYNRNQRENDDKFEHTSGPFSNKDIHGLKYKGVISEDEYNLSVEVIDEISIGAFLATAKLKPDSHIKMPVKDGSFRPIADLTGTMTTVFSSQKQKEAFQNSGQSVTTSGESGTSTSSETDMIRFKGITFQNLKVQTEKPYVSVKNMGYAAPLSIYKFPVSVDGIKFETGIPMTPRLRKSAENKGYTLDENDNTTNRLSFNLNINLGGGDNEDKILTKKNKEKIANAQNDKDKKKAEGEGLLFMASTRLQFHPKMINHEGSQKLKLLDVWFSKIGAKLEYLFFKGKGAGRWLEGDPEYGNGAVFDVEVEFKDSFSFKKKNADGDDEKNSSTLKIKGKIIAGNKLKPNNIDVDYTYLYLDGLVDVGVGGIPVFPGVFISGGALGFFVNMTRKMDPSISSPKFSPSGFAYKPRKGSGGFKGMLLGHIANKNAVDAGAGFEFEFNDKSGLKSVGIYGELKALKGKDRTSFMSAEEANRRSEKDPNWQKKPTAHDDIRDTRSTSEKVNQDEAGTEAGELVTLPDVDGVDARLYALYDFENEALIGDLDVYVDIANGLIEGQGRAKKAVEGRLRFSNKDEWYLHLGNPINRMGLIMGLDKLRASAFGYFMAGHKIPNALKPPYKVANILGTKLRALQNNRDNNAITTGTGFAFGLGFDFDTGHQRIGAGSTGFYFRFNAGLGVEAIMRKYDSFVSCGGVSPIGFNDGWYANGMAYVYIQGELGIRVELFGQDRRFDILKGSGAMLAKFGAPNPTWAKGRLAVRYSVLGGMFKGRFSSEISFLGEECSPISGGPLGGVKIISDFSPEKDTNEVDVFTSPQVTFSMEINKPIEIPNEENSDENDVYKIKLKKFTLTDENNKQVKGKILQEEMSATYESYDVLPPNQKMTTHVIVALEKKVNGVFKPYILNGKQYTEEKVVEFITGSAPDHIPLKNIKYSYPVVDQKLFYKNEYPTGYLQLDKGQDYLFENTQWDTKVKYINTTGKQEEIGITYDTSKNYLSYKIPSVENSEDYTISMVSFPKRSNVNPITTNTTNATNSSKEEDNTSIQIRKNKAENVVRDGEIERLGYAFRSSKYNTFKSKMNSIKYDNSFVGKVYTDVIYLSSTIQKHDEGFDLAEVKGTSYTDGKPLIVLESTLKDTYFKKDINPMLYSQYPVGGYTFRRDIIDANPVPKKSISPRTNYVASLEADTDKDWRLTSFPFKYMLSKSYKDDFSDIMTRISDDYHNGRPVSANALKFLDNRFWFMRQGKYQVKLEYMLPGGIKSRRSGSSTYNFIF